MILTDEDIEALGHRIAWRYKKSSDPHHSDTYTFNRATLLQFSEAVEREVLRKLRERPADAWMRPSVLKGCGPVTTAFADDANGWRIAGLSVQELHIIPEVNE